MNFELLCPPIKPGNENPIFSTGTSTIKEGFPITKLNYTYRVHVDWTCHLLGPSFQALGTPTGPNFYHFSETKQIPITCYSTYLKGLKFVKKTQRKSESSAETSPLTPDMNRSAPAPLPASLSNVAAPRFASFPNPLGMCFSSRKTREIHLRTWS